MKQVSQNYKSGAITIQEVNDPLLQPGGVLVQTCYSVISIGTEGMKVREGKMSYLEKARARPDQVKKVLQTLQEIGPVETYRKVINRLDSMTPLGYSLSGVVIEVGAECREFSVGQRVACGGCGHAELNYVPKNLVVPVSDNVPLKHAAFTTIGSIALHAYHQSGMQLGETACVIGLGLLGQILVQILHASGIRVVGIDIIEARCQIAYHLGASLVLQPDDASLFLSIEHFTGGNGVDCVFLVAGGSSNQPVELAVKVARDRARIVDIGKTNLTLPWNAYYEKELNVFLSRSYGPGRYDHSYEEQGIDYPIGYVRWTERRNMSAFLDQVATGSIQLDPLITAVIPFSEAPNVYQQISEGKSSGMGIIFEYQMLDRTPNPIPRSVTRSKPISSLTNVRVGVIGAGNFSCSVLLPILHRLSDVQLIEVATTSGLTSANAAKKFNFERTSTDYRTVLEATDIDAIIVATRHASHALLTAEAIRSGKAVFVEKPLAINLEGLNLVYQAIAESENDRLLVGFNRRYSPLIRELHNFFGSSLNPLVMTYRVHAGQIEASSWYHNPLEGSRFIGEAGHFLDIFSFLTGSRPISVFARSLHSMSTILDDIDNLGVLVTFEDGSLGNLLYLTQGSSKLPKEYLEVFGGGRTALLHNYRSIDLLEGNTEHQVKSRMDKGHSNELQSFIQNVKGGRKMPISIDSLLDTTLVTLAANESARTGENVLLPEFHTKMLACRTDNTIFGV